MGEGWGEGSGVIPQLAVLSLRPQSSDEFVFANRQGQSIRVAVPWREVRQLLRYGPTNYLATPGDPFIVVEGKLSSLGWPSRLRVNQVALAPDGALFVA